MKLTVRIGRSPDFSRRRYPPLFVGGLITRCGFRSSAPQAKNGFIPPSNCFVAALRTKQFATDINEFNELHYCPMEPGVHGPMTDSGQYRLG
jgi:hypothetical protein